MSDYMKKDATKFIGSRFHPMIRQLALADFPVSKRLKSMFLRLDVLFERTHIHLTEKSKFKVTSWIPVCYRNDDVVVLALVLFGSSTGQSVLIRHNNSSDVLDSAYVKSFYKSASELIEECHGSHIANDIRVTDLIDRKDDDMEIETYPSSPYIIEFHTSILQPNEEVDDAFVDDCYRSLHDGMMYLFSVFLDEEFDTLPTGKDIADVYSLMIAVCNGTHSIEEVDENRDGDEENDGEQEMDQDGEQEENDDDQEMDQDEQCTDIIPTSTEPMALTTAKKPIMIDLTKEDIEITKSFASATSSVITGGKNFVATKTQVRNKGFTDIRKDPKTACYQNLVKVQKKISDSLTKDEDGKPIASPVVNGLLSYLIACLHVLFGGPTNLNHRLSSICRLNASQKQVRGLVKVAKTFLSSQQTETLGMIAFAMEIDDEEEMNNQIEQLALSFNSNATQQIDDQMKQQIDDKMKQRLSEVEKQLEQAKMEVKKQSEMVKSQSDELSKKRKREDDQHEEILRLQEQQAELKEKLKAATIGSMKETVRANKTEKLLEVIKANTDDPTVKETLDKVEDFATRKRSSRTSKPVQRLGF